MLDLKNFAFCLSLQELHFLNGLVRLGKFNRDELQNVVQLLLPTKTEEQLQILDTLCEGYDARPSSRPDEYVRLSSYWTRKQIRCMQICVQIL